MTTVPPLSPCTTPPEGDDWEDNDNWLTDAPFDEWDGVETDVNGRVIILDLAGNDLAGHIPPELGELSELEVLELNSNLLTGILPPELGELSELEYLELSGNLLTGTLPPGAGKARQIDRLFCRGQLSDRDHTTGDRGPGFTGDNRTQRQQVLGGTSPEPDCVEQAAQA